MKVAITGHTAGIGKAVSDWFTSRDHTIIGFSRSNGYDLTNYATINEIVEKSVDADVFINNAHYRLAQVDLLFKIYEEWKDDPFKTILSISSRGADGTKSFAYPYAIHKKALDNTVEQLNWSEPKCRVMNIKPGYVDTARIANISARKLSIEYIAGVIGWMIEQEGKILSLTVTP